MKIIQIAATETTDEEGGYETLYALADDGSVWVMIDPWKAKRRAKPIWERLPDLGEVK